MKKSVFSSTGAMILAALGIVLNIILGTVVQTLSIPLLFLDTMGTIFVAALLGPFAGALTGGLTNIILGMITNPKNIPFALVNIVIGIIVGFVARRWAFNLKTAILTGLVLAVAAPLIGTPIAVWVFGGLTGGGTDFVFMWLLASGKKIFTAAFLPRIAGNLVDKVVSCILVGVLLQYLPKEIITLITNNHHVA